MGSKSHRNSLRPGYKIHWYEIKEILGQGGFGITYLAYDPNLVKNVAIKEYLPIELAIREGDYSIHPVSEERGDQFKWGLDRFISEARTLAQFDHPNIVRVLSVTEANNTAYMVMNYESGKSLQEKLKGRKTLEEPELIKILFPILGGLEQIHNAGFIHRDIKPDNIFIRDDGSPVLLDFGSARQALGQQTKTLTSLVTPGYAPFEQYYSKSDEQGPYTDIYGIGATLYRAVTGIPPLDSVDRSNAILKTSKDTQVLASEIAKGKYSERFLNAIDHALRFKYEERPQTIAEWKAEFNLPEDPIKEARAIESTPTQPGTHFVKQDRTENYSRGRLIVAFGVIVLAAIAGFFLWPGKEVEIGSVNNEIVQPTQPVPPIEQVAKIEATTLPASEKEATEPVEQAAEVQVKVPVTAPVVEKEIPASPEVKETPVTIAKIQPEKKPVKPEIAETKIDPQELKIQTLLTQAEEDITARRLLSPAGNNAYEKIQQIKQLDPGNKKTVILTDRIMDVYYGLLQQAIDQNNVEKILIYFDRMMQIDPDSGKVRQAEQSMAKAMIMDDGSHLANENDTDNLAGIEQPSYVNPFKAEDSINQDIDELDDIDYPEPQYKQPGINYGSIAYDMTNGAYGFSYDYDSNYSANVRAMQECGNHGRNCQVVVEFNDACAAFAVGPDSTGWAIDQTREAAERAAIGYCHQHGNNCQSKVWSCTTQSNY